jgi:hypothetical protein
MSTQRGQKTLDALARLSTKIDVDVSLFKEATTDDMHELPEDIQETIYLRTAALEETKTHLAAIANLLDKERFEELAKGADADEIRRDLSSIVQRGLEDDLIWLHGDENHGLQTVN